MPEAPWTRSSTTPSPGALSRRRRGPALSPSMRARLPRRARLRFRAINRSYAADPVTHDIYRPSLTGPAIAIVDPQAGSPVDVFDTPGLAGNALVRFDARSGKSPLPGGTGCGRLRPCRTCRAPIVPPGVALRSRPQYPRARVHRYSGADVRSIAARRRSAALLGTIALSGPALAALDAQTDDSSRCVPNPDGGGMDLNAFMPRRRRFPAASRGLFVRRYLTRARIPRRDPRRHA